MEADACEADVEALVTHISFVFVSFFVWLSGGGSDVCHVVSLPGVNLLHVAFLIFFNCWGGDGFFSSSDLGEESTDACSLSEKASGALVPALRRHGVVDLFSGREVRISSAACLVPAWLLLRQGRTICCRFLLPLHRFLRREAVAVSAGGFASLASFFYLLRGL